VSREKCPRTTNS